jgi:hypothetical protein
LRSTGQQTPNGEPSASRTQIAGGGGPFLIALIAQSGASITTSNY